MNSGNDGNQSAIRRTKMLLAVAVSVLLVACSSGSGNDVTTAKGAVGTPPAGDGSPGLGPARDILPDPDLELTGDTVVVRSDGGRAVKRFEDDGETIVIDAGANGADDLDEGEVMLLTGVTVVRVAGLEKAGDELRITGAPVSLPEVIYNGELSWDDVEVDMTAARLSVWGGEARSGSGSGSGGPSPSRGAGQTPLPGLGRGGGAAPAGGAPSGTGVPSEEDVVDLWDGVNDVFSGGDGEDLFGLGEQGDGVLDLNRERVVLTSAVEEPAADSDGATTAKDQQAPADDDNPPVEKKEFTHKVKIGAATYTVTHTKIEKTREDIYQLGLELGAGPEEKDVGELKLKGSIDTEVKLKPLRHSGHAGVVNGEVQDYEIRIPDLSGEISVTAKLQALSPVASMTSDPLFDLPLSLEFPYLVGGIPFTLKTKVGVQVNTSLAMANNTLSGLAKVTFEGDAGFKYDGAQFSVFGTRVQNAEDLLKSVQGVVDGPVGLVFTNELPKVSFGLGHGKVFAGVFVSNGYVVSFHILPMPAPCTAANVSYVPAWGMEGEFFGLEVEFGRKAITDKRWHFQIPKDGRCNAP